MNWSDLTPRQMAQVESEYRSGREPGEIAPRFGLKPKQVSDQAYRKNWAKPGRKSRSSSSRSSTKAKKGKKSSARSASAKRRSR